MDEKRSRVTIYDIARELNISPSTVTRSLNNQSCISKETRRLVHETADRLGYRKNMLAHGLKSKPAKIGIILRNRFPEYQNLIFAGARRACAELADFNASIETAILDVQDFGKSLISKTREFIEAGCDGIVFAAYTAGSVPQELESLITESGVKAASIFYSMHMDCFDFCVSADNTCSGRIAADLFSFAGLKSGDMLAYFTPQSSMEHHVTNLNGFLQMSEKYGFDVRVIEHQDNEKIAYYAAEQLILEHSDIKGMFCSTAVTKPVCDKLAEAGRAQDIVLIGTELLTTSLPYLEDGTLNAVIFQNPFKMGYLAYKHLFDCVNGSAPDSRSIYINPHIVIRGNLSYYEKRITNVDMEY